MKTITEAVINHQLSLSSNTSSIPTTSGGAPIPLDIYNDDESEITEDSAVNEKSSIKKEGCKLASVVLSGISTATFAVTKPFSSNIINSALFSLGVGVASSAVLAGAIALSYRVYKLWNVNTPREINEQKEKLVPPNHSTINIDGLQN